MRNLIKILIPLQFIFCAAVLAQQSDKPFASKGDISFYVDQTSFYGNNEKTYQEFSLMVYPDNLKLVQKDGKQISILKILAKIETTVGNAVFDKNWTTEAWFDTVGDPRTKVIYDSWGVLLEPGEYKIIVTVSDEEGRSRGAVEGRLIIPGVETKKINVSQIQFLNNVIDPINPQETGGVSKTHNSARRFGILNPALQFYYEVYAAPGSIGKEIAAKFSIKDFDGKEVKSISETGIKLNKATVGFSQAINVSKLQSGIYNLEITLADSSGSFSVSTGRNFEIIQADYFSKTAFLTKEDSDIIGQILGYIATPEQLSFYNNLNSNGKANFLIKYFRDLDPVPQSAKNEYLETLFERYHYSKQKFGWGKTEGWATERGRVFIQNGKPDEVEYHTFDANSKPYEIWYYRRDREVFFIFVDMRNDGKFILVHSNKNGEVSNYDWREYLK